MTRVKFNSGAAVECDTLPGFGYETGWLIYGSEPTFG